MYSCLSNNRPCSQVHSLNKWVEELNVPLTQAQWQRAFTETHKASCCTNHWESYQKTVHRWYLTPYRLPKMYPGQSPSCWRNCGSIGSIAHTLWFCKSLSSFWNQVFALISSITGISCSPTPALALLHIGIEKFPTQSRCVILHLLYAAKLIITRLWKTTTVPSISSTVADFNIQCEMERIVARKNVNVKKYMALWSLWLQHLKCTVQV